MMLIHKRLPGHIWLIMIALLLVHPAALAQDKSKQSGEPTLEEIKRQRVVYSVPGMEQARVRKNLTYKTIGSLQLQADAYTPRTLRRSERRPAIIFVPGDAPWEILKDIKDWGVYVSYGQLAAATGFVGITFNHRSTERFTKLREVAGDVDNLVAYVRQHADSLGVDRERICVWAFSAGGPFLRTIFNDKPAFVRCIVTYYSLLGVAPGAAADEIVREFTLANYLSRKTRELAPMLVVRAGNDAPFINNTVDEFLREAIKQNIDIELVNYVEGQHAFDVLDDKERTREIIRRTLDFIKLHLR
jgi:acetyl esterase/lipase